MIERLKLNYGRYSYTHSAAAFMIVICLWGITRLSSLRGEGVVPFLLLFIPLGMSYLMAVVCLGTEVPSPTLVWGFAVVFRMMLLTTEPTLSDDVYRYIWDGHLFNQGVNPYLHQVNSQALDTYTTTLRALVNNDWMASPYLPAAQWFFALVSGLAPQNPLAFQISALILDLATGWIILDLLRRLNLPQSAVLIYLWNPLVILEFSHGAHIDSLMNFFIMLSFWLIVWWDKGERRNSVGLWGSAITLAAATLTKGLPLLLSPLFLRRWGWMRTVLYALVIAAALVFFAAGAGWGLTGPLDGTGVFGALRIYTRYWNFNGSIYHWLEVLVTGYNTPGAVPVEIAGEATLRTIRLSTFLLIGIASLAAGVLAWRRDTPQGDDSNLRSLYLIRLALLPAGAYLIFTHTLHPWYVTFIIPLLPFFLPQADEGKRIKRLLWPWIYLSLGIVASYYTYLNPEDLREYTWVRIFEYIPFYGLLLWGLGTFFYRGGPSTSVNDTL